MDTNQIRTIIRRFLDEDIGSGDITSESIFTADHVAEAVFVAKEDFIAAGMREVALEVFLLQNSTIECLSYLADGSQVRKGDIILVLKGPTLDLLKAERVALNLVQRLCGIATLTKKFVDRVGEYATRIVDTRKTTPGLRVLEKYAVKVGGGHNHRFNLADGVLIKDNHIAACGSITKAVDKVRANIPHTLKIEVEAENLAQVKECLAAGVEIIMLDNMDYAVMKEAVKLVNGRAILEASGGVTLENVRDFAATGVDIISIGRLTHSAPAVDISMRLANEE